jgi:CubicO group peptidase (beta-lactamase class C family)
MRIFATFVILFCLLAMSSAYISTFAPNQPTKDNFDLIAHLKATNNFNHPQFDSAPESPLFGTEPFKVFSESVVLDEAVKPSNYTELDKKQITRYFEQFANHGLFYGSAAFYKNGELFTIQTGFVDDKKTKRPNQDSKYRFGSITKTLTAVLIMKAIEEKKLSLQTPLGNFISHDEDGNVLKQANSVTIQTMLNHRSFLYNYTNDPEFNLYAIHKYNDILKFIIKHQDQMPPPNSPNGQYSNSNYYLLGHILELIYKKPLQELYSEHFFGPFNMTQSTVIQQQTYPDSNYTNHPRNDINEVSSFLPIVPFEWKPTQFGGYTSWETTAGAGTLLTTPTDMVKFYISIFVKHKFISVESIQLMRKYSFLGDLGVNYGNGIYETAFASPINGQIHHGFGHNGSLDGFMSQISISPQRPGGDPIFDPFHIYVQSTNGYNTNVAAPIIAMNNYMLSDQKIPITIPDIIQYDDQSLYKYYNNTWTCPTLNNIKVITNFTQTQVTKIKNWNTTLGDWEYIDRYQMLFQVMGQEHGIAISTAGQQGIYAYWPGQLFFRFLFTQPQTSPAEKPTLPVQNPIAPVEKPTFPATQFIINVGGNNPHYCQPV